MKTKLSLSVLLIAAFLLSACGSPATPNLPPAPPPTAVPPTATPIPPSPTPIPYDLTVTVVDESGNPVTWANVSLVELNLSAAVNESGQATWTDLSQGNVTMRVTAQGYAGAEQQFSLNRGANEQTITLARVPFGMLPSQACAPGETLLYAEDFQDGAVENWATYPPGKPIHIVADSQESGNSVLALEFGNADGQFTINTIPFQQNVVRRLKYKPGDHSRFHFGWGGGGSQNSIEAILSADEFTLNSWQSDGRQVLGKSKPVMEQGLWHLAEISTFGDAIEIWVDGTLRISYQGASVTEGSNLYFGSAQLPPSSIVYLDDISICGLSAPFVPMPAAAP